MNIKKSDLITALKFPGTLAKRKTTIPICSCFRIQCTDGVFDVQSSDSAQFCGQVVDAKDAKGSLDAFCVPMAALQSLVGFFEDKVTMELKDGKLLINSGGKFSLRVMDAAEFPTFNPEGSVSLKVEANLLAEAIGDVSFCSSDNAIRTEWYGVHVKCEPKKMYADAYNGICYARHEKALKSIAAEFFIPLEFVENARQAMLNENADIKIMPNMLLVGYPNGGYACKLTELKFINVDSFMESARVVIGEIVPSAWLPAFQGAIDLSGVDSGIVCKTSIKKDAFEHVSQNGEIKVKLPGKMEACDLNLNAVTFVKCLGAFKESEAKASIAKNGAVCLTHGDLTVITSQLRNQ